MGSPPPGEQLSCIRVIAFSPAFFLEQFFLLSIIIFFSFFFFFFSHVNDVQVYFWFFMDIMILFFFSTSYTSNVHIHKAELPFKNKPVCDKAVTDAKYTSSPHSRTGLAAPVYSQ